VKKLPDASLLNKFEDHSAQLSTNLSSCRRNIKHHIKELQAIQKGMLKLGEHQQLKFDYPADLSDETCETATSDTLWK
jgi:hypothetical protein